MKAKNHLLGIDQKTANAQAEVLVRRAAEQAQVSRYSLKDNLVESRLSEQDISNINQALHSPEAMGMAKGVVSNPPKDLPALNFQDILNEMVSRFSFKKTDGYEVTGPNHTKFAPRKQQKAQKGGSGSRSEKVKSQVQANPRSLYKGATAAIVLDAARGIAKQQLKPSSDD